MTNIYTQMELKEMDFLDQLNQAQTHKPSKDEQRFIDHVLMLQELMDEIPTLALSYHGHVSSDDIKDIIGLYSFDFDSLVNVDYDENIDYNLAYELISECYHDTNYLQSRVLEYFEN